MLALLYLAAHIDRANIGNAKIEGMIEDLGMTGVQYNTVLSICERDSSPSSAKLLGHLYEKPTNTLKSLSHTSYLKSRATYYSRNSSDHQHTLVSLS